MPDYRSERLGFALRPAPGWQIHLDHEPDGPWTVVGWASPEEDGARGVFDVSVRPGGALARQPGASGPSTPQEHLEQAKAALALPALRHEGERLERVAGLEATRLVYSYQGRSCRIRATAVTVFGADATYQVLLYAPVERFTRYGPMFEAMLASFAVGPVVPAAASGSARVPAPAQEAAAEAQGRAAGPEPVTPPSQTPVPSPVGDRGQGAGDPPAPGTAAQSLSGPGSGKPKAAPFAFFREPERQPFMRGVFVLGGFVAMPILFGFSVDMSYLAALPWSLAACAGMLVWVRPNGTISWGRYVGVTVALSVVAVGFNLGTGQPAFVGATGMAGFVIVWGCGRAGVALTRRFGRWLPAEGTLRLFREGEFRPFLTGVVLLGGLAAGPAMLVLWWATLFRLSGQGYLSAVATSLVCGGAVLLACRRNGTVAPYRALAAFAAALLLDTARLDGWARVLGDPVAFGGAILGAFGGARIAAMVLLAVAGQAGVALWRRFGDRLRAASPVSGLTSLARGLHGGSFLHRFRVRLAVGREVPSFTGTNLFGAPPAAPVGQPPPTPAPAPVNSPPSAPPAPAPAPAATTTPPPLPGPFVPVAAAAADALDAPGPAAPGAVARPRRRRAVTVAAGLTAVALVALWVAALVRQRDAARDAAAATSAPDAPGPAAAADPGAGGATRRAPAPAAGGDATLEARAQPGAPATVAGQWRCATGNETYHLTFGEDGSVEWTRDGRGGMLMPSWLFCRHWQAADGQFVLSDNPRDEGQTQAWSYALADDGRTLRLTDAKGGVLTLTAEGAEPAGATAGTPAAAPTPAGTGPDVGARYRWQSKSSLPFAGDGFSVRDEPKGTAVKPVAGGKGSIPFVGDDLMIDLPGTRDVHVEIDPAVGKTTYAGLVFSTPCVLDILKDTTVVARQAGVSAKDRDGNSWVSRAATLDGQPVVAFFRAGRAAPPPAGPAVAGRSTPAAAAPAAPAPPIPRGWVVSPRNTEQPGKAGFRVLHPQLDVEMVYVPGGRFTMGFTDDDVRYITSTMKKWPREPDEKGADEMVSAADLTASQPAHEVEISGFWIGLAEVTRLQLAKAECGVGKVADYLPGGQFAAIADISPGAVLWAKAVRFCRQLGVRLPTEAEWEYAARGPESRRFPWGNDWSPRKAGSFAFTGYANDVSSAADVSWCGAIGMSGGDVPEWCSDLFDLAYYGHSPKRDPQGPATGALAGAGQGLPNMRVIKGGHRMCVTSRDYLPASRRWCWEAGMPDAVGLRIAMSAAGASPPAEPAAAARVTPVAAAPEAKAEPDSKAATAAGTDGKPSVDVIARHLATRTIVGQAVRNADYGGSLDLVLADPERPTDYALALGLGATDYVSPLLNTFATVAVDTTAALAADPGYVANVVGAASKSAAESESRAAQVRLETAQNAAVTRDTVLRARALAAKLPAFRSPEFAKARDALAARLRAALVKDAALLAPLVEGMTVSDELRQSRARVRALIREVEASPPAAADRAPAPPAPTGRTGSAGTATAAPVAPATPSPAAPAAPGVVSDSGTPTSAPRAPAQTVREDRQAATAAPAAKRAPPAPVTPPLPPAPVPPPAETVPETELAAAAKRLGVPWPLPETTCSLDKAQADARLAVDAAVSREVPALDVAKAKAEVEAKVGLWKVGQTIEFSDARGRSHRGRLTRLTPARIEVGGTWVNSVDFTQEMQRHMDPALADRAVTREVGRRVQANTQARAELAARLAPAVATKVLRDAGFVRLGDAWCTRDQTLARVRQAAGAP